MRRLYSTFTGGRPGVGLLWLRLVLASVLLLRGALEFGVDVPLQSNLAAVSLAGSAVLLAVGLWTPLAGAFVAVAEIARVLAAGGDPVVAILAGTIGGAVALLGPGRWSVDAHLFGWRRIDAPARANRANSV